MKNDKAATLKTGRHGTPVDIYIVSRGSSDGVFALEFHRLDAESEEDSFIADVEMNRSAAERVFGAFRELLEMAARKPG